MITLHTFVGGKMIEKKKKIKKEGTQIALLDTNCVWLEKGYNLSPKGFFALLQYNVQKVAYLVLSSFYIIRILYKIIECTLSMNGNRFSTEFIIQSN